MFNRKKKKWRDARNALDSWIGVARSRGIEERKGVMMLRLGLGPKVHSYGLWCTLASLDKYSIFTLFFNFYDSRNYKLFDDIFNLNLIHYIENVLKTILNSNIT